MPSEAATVSCCPVMLGAKKLKAVADVGVTAAMGITALSEKRENR